MSLIDAFTSTGSKFFAHQEAMENLRNGRGQAITTHVMLTDICQHTCAFCSVATRGGDVLKMAEVRLYLRTLMVFGLKSVILSGGGNPLLYKCPTMKAGISEMIRSIDDFGLEIGMITNGMPLKDFGGRRSYATLEPDALDRLKWLRISMSGLDHEEETVFVPDVDPGKTTLGFSYVYHDIYDEPADPNHGKVSTEADRITPGTNVLWGADRLWNLTNQIAGYAIKYQPEYIRLLPNCLEPEKIADRCNDLREAAREINRQAGRDVAFVQYKPPAAPDACYLGYIHPVLNSDGYVYPCDSCVLNAAAGHKFANPWRICHWSEIASVYNRPVGSLIADPASRCPGCVFTRSNQILGSIVNGGEIREPAETQHANFV